MCCRVRKEMGVKGEQPVTVGSGYYHRPTVVGAIGSGVATVYFTIFVIKIL
jgi:predicted RNA-binding protein with TRAM domain